MKLAIKLLQHSIDSANGILSTGLADTTTKQALNASIRSAFKAIAILKKHEKNAPEEESLDELVAAAQDVLGRLEAKQSHAASLVGDFPHIGAIINKPIESPDAFSFAKAQPIILETIALKKDQAQAGERETERLAVDVSEGETSTGTGTASLRDMPTDHD